MTKRFRDYNLALLLLAGSALLSTVLFSQWLHYRDKQSDLKKLLATKVEARMETQKAEEQHFELPGLEEYTATVERPLFMEGRRPATEDASEPEATPVEKKPLTIKLMGVVFAPEETLGLFVDAQGKYKRLRINDSIGGWKVTKIEPDKATMEQDGAPPEELKLAKPKSKKPPGPGQAKPGGPTPFGQPVPGQPMPGQQAPPFGAMNPNNPNMPEEPIDTEQPNEAVDETAFPPEEPQNGQ
jgi:type II secretory pathway component PulC